MADKSKIAVEFRALQLTNEQRSAYGLRYNDFTRYRKHSANRTHRLRSSLKMTHGKGRDFKKLPPLTPEIAKDGHLQLLLFEAERAWAYAQELINSALQPANKDHARALRHTATGRFRRAVNWSAQLLSLCQAFYKSSRLSARGLIEATVYTVILNGRFLRYRDDFEDAVIQLSVAKSLLDDLAGSSSTSRDQALAVLFADEISPEVRYCAHELGRAKAYDVNGIVAEIAPKYRNEIVEDCDALLAKLHKEECSTSSVSNLATRLWEGQPVPIRYPELVDVLLRVQTAESTLEQSQQDARGKKSKQGVTAYDGLLLALSDAEEVARKLQETHQFHGTGGRDIHFVHAYIVYQLLSRRIQRDLLLITTLLGSGGGDNSKLHSNVVPAPVKGKPEPVDNRLYPAVVKLLDTTLQSLAQMRTLSIVDDNPDLASAIDTRLAFSNARRCVYLARCYSTVKKYGEALALLQHATIHIRETTSSMSLSESDIMNSMEPSFFVMKDDAVKSIENVIASHGLQYKQDWFANNGGSFEADTSSYKKPLFFNIALNYVELDMDRLRHRAGKEPVEAPTPVNAAIATSKVDAAPDRKSIPKTRAEEQAGTALTSQQPMRGGLSSLLGGWWSKS
ncbi:hypothetical protein CPB84DRAFT_1816027 [Gymnopilus junonius]|uniref:Signal recognition particle subunit SRP68 n=1 Tax=Gymnopilus junonius TaxID=109634 RepID=A0A9P5NIE3_GYMJU|nr:hypothetical protein CPB84DRAFT_1816027 [Gymnopilus junonius]